MNVSFLSNTFRVKRSPKKSLFSDPPQVCTKFSFCLYFSILHMKLSKTPSALQEPDSKNEPSSHPQDDHATDEEKLASSTSHKWAALCDMDAEFNSDQQDVPQPSDLTSFVNENSFPHQAPGEA